MGHLLATVNPEAAAAIRPEPNLPRLPRVGEVLKFYPRPGEGRGGRLEYAVHVTSVHSGGLVNGIVMYDAQDFRDVINIPPRSDALPWPSWEFMDQTPLPSMHVVSSDAPSLVRSELNELREHITALAVRVEIMENAGGDKVLSVLRSRILAVERKLTGRTSVELKTATGGVVGKTTTSSSTG